MKNELFLLLSLAFPVITIHADIYKCKDEKGSEVFTNQPCMGQGMIKQGEKWITTEQYEKEQDKKRLEAEELIRQKVAEEEERKRQQVLATEKLYVDLKKQTELEEQVRREEISSATSRGLYVVEYRVRCFDCLFASSSVSFKNSSGGTDTTDFYGNDWSNRLIVTENYKPYIYASSYSDKNTYLILTVQIIVNGVLLIEKKSRGKYPTVSASL